MNVLTLEAPAKINLTLAVGAKRPDGYHEIEMRYFPRIYKLGIAVTTLGIATFVLIVLYAKCEKFRLFVCKRVSGVKKIFKKKETELTE